MYIINKKKAITPYWLCGDW